MGCESTTKFENEELAAKRQRHLNRLRNEYFKTYEMSEDAYRAAFVDPPSQKVNVMPYIGTDIGEAISESGAHEEKLVMLDVIREAGETHLVTRDLDGSIGERLLTWDHSGFTRRHFSIDPGIGLSLSLDGSLRGLLMDAPNARVAIMADKETVQGYN